MVTGVELSRGHRKGIMIDDIKEWTVNLTAKVW